MRSLVLLIMMLTPMQAFACQRWVQQVQEGPFVFRSEVRIQRGPLTRDLAQIKTALEQELKLKVSDDLIQVFLFRDARSYRAYMQRHVPEAIKRRALFVKGPNGSQVYAYSNASVDTDLRHECTHALVHNALPFVPLWMDEGLSEYFELKAGTRVRPARFNEVRKSVTGLARLMRSRKSLKQLESVDEIGQMGASEYRDSWAWIHFLLHDQNNKGAGRTALVDYLAEIQKGNPPGAFSDYLAKRLPSYETNLVQHFRYFQ